MRYCNIIKNEVLLVALLLHTSVLLAADVVTDLKATVRSGQVFLTWKEARVPAGVTFDVFMDSRPIEACTFSRAEHVGHHIEAGSACDWWQDPASFDPDAEPDRTHGFRIDGKELNTASGLFVHTICDEKPMYFTVLPSTAEASAIVPGVNSLKTAVQAAPAMPQPILLGTDPKHYSGAGKSLTLRLHGRGEGNENSKANYLVFGDGRQGWREGLARKFFVESTGDRIIIHPLDRLWIGRPLLYSWDRRDHVPAINTWWYGCNQYIYDADAVKEGVVVNYTEEHLLYLVRWAQETFGTDPDRTYIRGGSMGGSGAIAMGFHHPDVFATIFAYVPVVAYTRRAGSDGKSNLLRLDGISGRPCDETVMSIDNLSVMERMNSERIALESTEELPFLMLCNGRTDMSIPWINNPSFYQALNRGRRGFAVFWNNGAHGMGASVPEDLNEFYSTQPTMSLGTSFPAFSNFSGNRDPGEGDKDDGDLIGWMNRGLYWTDIEETEDSWSIQLHARGSFLPQDLTVDVTPRRLSRFHVSPGETFIVNGQPVEADEDGLLTIPNVHLNKGVSVSLKVQRSFQK